MMSSRVFAKLQISSASDLRGWLQQNHAQQESVWLVTWKKTSDGPYVPRRDIVEALLAFGWIKANHPKGRDRGPTR